MTRTARQPRKPANRAFVAALLVPSAQTQNTSAWSSAELRTPPTEFGSAMAKVVTFDGEGQGSAREGRTFPGESSTSAREGSAVVREGPNSAREGPGLRPRRSELRPRGSELRPRGSELRPRGSGLRPRGSGTPPAKVRTPPAKVEPPAAAVRTSLTRVDASPATSGAGKRLLGAAPNGRMIGKVRRQFEGTSDFARQAGPHRGCSRTINFFMLKQVIIRGDQIYAVDHNIGFASGPGAKAPPGEL